MAAPLFFVPAVSISYRPSSPSPPMRRVISSMRSSGNGGSHRGFSAIDMSFMGLSSAAVRLELRAPQRRHRWMMAHSPPRRTQTATGSMIPPQSASRSPGSMSTCRLARQFGQWLRWLLPALSGVQSLPQTLQVKAYNSPFSGSFACFHGSLCFPSGCCVFRFSGRNGVR